MGIFRRAEKRSAVVSVGDPAILEFFGLSSSLTGVSVGEKSALGLSAVYRAVSLIAGTIAALPLKSYRTLPDGSRERVPSFLDDPAGPDSDVTPFEWKETALVSLLLHGDAFFWKVRNQAGGLAGLEYLHPAQVTVERAAVPGGRLFKVTLDKGVTRTVTSQQMLHVPAMSADGLRGLGPLQVARESLGMSIAGERTAARMFGNGALVSGIVTPEEDLSEDDAIAIKESLRAKMLGQDNAGDVAVINRKLKFSPWAMNLRDAQFLESREFQVIEVARWFGLPPHLLGETQRQTSWGSGVEEQNHGLSRFTLTPWTTRFEQRLSPMLPSPRFCEFDYSGLLKPTPATEIDLLIRQVREGFLTLNEARAVRNLEPLEGGDKLRLPPGSLPDTDPNDDDDQDDGGGDDADDDDT